MLSQVAAGSEYKIEFVSCLLCRVGSDKERRYFFVEPFIEGRYIKWNSNSGYVRPQEEFIREEDPGEEELEFEVEDLPQAFSHWSYCYCLYELDEPQIICDLQGFYDVQRKAFTLTDPVLHSSGFGGVYACTDHGRKGIANFFATHQCNSLCRLLELESPSPCPHPYPTTAEKNVAQEPAPLLSSIPTSEIHIEKTFHLIRRQKERDISTKELRRAVKRGEKTAHQDGTIKHVFQGLAFITDNAAEVGITGYRIEGK